MLNWNCLLYTSIKGINNGCFAIAPYINDSILIGTGAGLRVVHENADSGGFFFLSDLNKFLVGAIKTVSYTHLDVYKRQM